MDLPNRKRPRLKDYDYSLPGYYYVTIHISDGAPILSTVGQVNDPSGKAQADLSRPTVTLTSIGKIAQQQLFTLQTRFPNVQIDKYVIMPTHIHAIIRLLEPAAGASPRPTLMDVVGVYKSLTTREANRVNHTPGAKLFQTSFYETVLRNEQAYQKCWLYIDGNPDKWFLSPEDR